MQGLSGVENLDFDGEEFLYVTCLDGKIYRIKSTEDPYRGIVDISKKIGHRCLGVEVGNDGMVYVGVEDKAGDRRIARLTKDFKEFEFVSDIIRGLNGLTQDSVGYFGPVGRHSIHTCNYTQSGDIFIGSIIPHHSNAADGEQNRERLP